MRTRIYLGILVSGCVIFLAVDDIGGRESFKKYFQKNEKNTCQTEFIL